MSIINNKNIYISQDSFVVNIVNDEYYDKSDDNNELFIYKNETHGVDSYPQKKITKRKLVDQLSQRPNSKKAKETRTKQKWIQRVSNSSNNLDVNEQVEEEKLIIVINVVNEEDQDDDKNLENISHTFTKNMNINLYRSKMCVSVDTNNPCPHGKMCRYAHSIDELNVVPCFFKRTCRRVEYREGIYHNCEQGPKCGFLHPGEDMINYCQRMNIKTKSPQEYDDPKTIVNKFTTPVKSHFKQIFNKTTPVKSHFKQIFNKKRPLCRYVNEKKICPHGKNCRFRHIKK